MLEIGYSGGVDGSGRTSVDLKIHRIINGMDLKGHPLLVFHWSLASKLPVGQ
jgi:hypothetical protein